MGIQTRIAKATHEGKCNLVKRLQYLLTSSYSAKALAVRTITQNRGSRTPGVDGVLWRLSHQKMEAVLGIIHKKYTSKPLKRIYIPKPERSAVEITHTIEKLRTKVNNECANVASVIHSVSMKAGHDIGVMDYFIAATAWIHDEQMLTNDNHFNIVNLLGVEIQSEKFNLDVKCQL